MGIPQTTEPPFVQGTLEKLRLLGKRIFKSAVFRFTRGQPLFFAEGGLFIESKSATRIISEWLASSDSRLAGGSAYKRLGIKTAFGAGLTVDTVLVNSVGRLGNSIIQFGNALHIAKTLGATRIMYFRWDAIQGTDTQLEGVRLSRLRLSRPAHGQATRVIWRTQAFKSGAIAFELQENRAPTWAKELSVALGRQHSVIDGHSLHLTIHLRSGDVFEQAPHPDYGQPPFAFYQRVLEHKQWSLVNILTEDDRNPCLAHIQAWCETNRVAVSVSGTNLSQTLDVLGSSSHIAIGTGTFVPGVQILDDHPRTFYVFAAEPHLLLMCKGNNIFLVEDLARTYRAEVMQRNWANTEHQRWLMQNYSVEWLSPPKTLNAENDSGTA